MLTYPRWKYALAVVLLLLSVLYALPNVFPQDPSVQVTANHGAAIDAQLQQRVTTLLTQAGTPPKGVDVVGDLKPDAEVFPVTD